MQVDVEHRGVHRRPVPLRQVLPVSVAAGRLARHPPPVSWLSLLEPEDAHMQHPNLHVVCHRHEHHW